MRKRLALARMLADVRGATAVEFAMVGPVFLLLVIGIIYVCLLLFCAASMQYAVEKGARCSSVATTICTDSASTITYTNAAYYGPFGTPTFTYAARTCGHSVTGTKNFALHIFVTTLTVPLSATACFP
jgi:Flp pilus assembly protein TadG